MWVMRPVMFSMAFPKHVHITHSSGAGLLNAHSAFRVDVILVSPDVNPYDSFIYKIMQESGKNH